MRIDWFFHLIYRENIETNEFVFFNSIGGQWLYRTVSSRVVTRSRRVKVKSWLWQRKRIEISRWMECKRCLMSSKNIMMWRYGRRGKMNLKSIVTWKMSKKKRRKFRSGTSLDTQKLLLEMTNLLFYDRWRRHQWWIMCIKTVLSNGKIRCFNRITTTFFQWQMLWSFSIHCCWFSALDNRKWS